VYFNHGYFQAGLAMQKPPSFPMQRVPPPERMLNLFTIQALGCCAMTIMEQVVEVILISPISLECQALLQRMCSTLSELHLLISSRIIIAMV
jgi:hypothetical protein